MGGGNLQLITTLDKSLGPDPAFSIIIPAHNEEGVIGRCLAALTDGADPGELEIVVVCNGCNDATAEVVRKRWPSVVVVELPVAGKSAALNEGDRHATVYPRFYVDADVEVTVTALRRVAEAMASSGVECAAPKPEFVLEGRPWAIRAFYRVWQDLPYLNDETVGSGVYALTESGRQRFSDFPGLTADDQFVMQQFARSERRSVEAVAFKVHTPRHLSGLIRMRRRVYRGNQELALSGMAPNAPTGGRARGLSRLVLRPRLLPQVVVYVGVNAFAMARARLGHQNEGWERDESARRIVTTEASGSTVGYLVSRYPSISHTFVLREILAARSAGLDIATFSVRRANESDLLADIDRSEAAHTWSLRPAQAIEVAAAHWNAFRRAPWAWLGTLWVAVSASPPGLRAFVWQLLYFVQAVMLWNECDRRHIRHLHAHLANVAADIAWLASDFGRRADPGVGWGWSLSIHGPTEFFDVGRTNLPSKVTSAKLVLCISDFARSQLMAISRPSEWSKFVVVHMGADLERYGAARTRRQSPVGAPTRVLSVGRLDPVKGQAILLQAVARLRDSGLPIHLTLVGDGPALGDLKDVIDEMGLQESVAMLGALGQDALPELYAEADIFCLASFAEGVPVVLMEAMACGLPAVSTRIAGIPELIDDGRSGLLVPPGRTDLLAEALHRLAEDPTLRAQLGEAGRETVVREYDAYLCGRRAAAYLADLVGVALDPS